MGEGNDPAVGMTARRHGVHVASTGAPEVSEWIKGPSPRIEARVRRDIAFVGLCRRDRPVTIRPSA